MRRVVFEIGGGEEIGHLAFESGPRGRHAQVGARARGPSPVKVNNPIGDLLRF
jgi:hypothetical protein